MSAVEVRGVGFVYPDGTRALEGVSLRVERGERVAIVGQNGSGKSTLVRQLNGLLRPTEGDVLLGGEPTAGRRVAQLARTVGLAFQNPDRQIFASSVGQEVAFGARNLGLDGDALDAAVRAALTSTGLEEHAATNPYDLGFSRRKLLTIASVLAMGTPVVVLDEPTTGQDARGVERIERIVADLAAEGRTVIAISHDMRFVAESFERVVVMRAGAIVLDATPVVAFSDASRELLASTFLEAPLVARLGERLGLGATPTESGFAAALAARTSATRERARPD